MQTDIAEKPERRADTTPGGSGYVEKNAEPNGSVQRKTLMKIADLGKVIKSLSMEENKKFNEEFKVKQILVHSEIDEYL